MSMKLLFLKHYLKDAKILYIISHDSFIYMWMLFKYLLFLVLLYGAYWLVYTYIFQWDELNTLMTWIFGISWIMVYFYFIIDFLDYYLDSIVLTETGLVIFNWDWLLKYKTQTLNREAIDAVDNEQSWIFDVAFNKWNLTIRRENEKYKFEDVHNPNKKIELIMETKNDLAKDETTVEPELDKFDILVETLWEIIKEYWQNPKDKPKSDNIYLD